MTLPPRPQDNVGRAQKGLGGHYGNSVGGQVGWRRMRVICTSQNYHHLSIMVTRSKRRTTSATLSLFARLPYDNGMPNAVAGNLPFRLTIQERYCKKNAWPSRDACVDGRKSSRSNRYRKTLANLEKTTRESRSRSP